MTVKEQRYTDYLNSKVTDTTFDSWTIVYYDENSTRAVFRALKNNIRTYYYIDEITSTDDQGVTTYSYNINGVSNHAGYPGMEQRFNTYLASKVTDTTFDMATMVNIWENLSRCEFKGSINGTVKLYYLTESGVDSYDQPTDQLVTTFSYSYIQEQNTSDNGVIALDDSRINKMLLDAAQDIPKNQSSTDTDLLMQTRVQSKIFLWKEIIKNNLIPVDPNIAEGLDLLEQDDSNLTPDQITKKYFVYNWILKLNSRAVIEQSVGDFYDLLADISKRVALIERAVMRMGDKLINGATWDSDTQTRYSNYFAWYCQMVDSGQFEDRIDLEVESDLINTLMTRAATITQIMKSYYFDLKK